MPIVKKTKKRKSSKKSARFNFFRRRSAKQKFIMFLAAALAASVGAAFIIQSFAASPLPSATDTNYLLLTAYRREKGKADLFRSQCLSQAAQDWANKMADGAGLNHSGFVTVGPRCGGAWKDLGENIGGINAAISAYGGEAGASLSIFNSLKASSGHNANMLNNYWNKVGIGAAQGADGRLWVAQIFAVASGQPWDTPYAPPFVSKIKGSFDSANCEKISGWAYHTSSPNAPIAVKIVLADGKNKPYEFIYNGTNVYRPDVNEAHKIKGNHGFVMGVPLEWQNRTFIADVKAIEGSHLTPVGVGARGVACGANYAIDHNAENVTYGWAFDRNYKSEPLQITIRYCWDAFNTNCPTQKVVKTNVARPDVNTKYGLSNYHGFKIAAPAPFNAYDHYTFIYAKNTQNGQSMYIGGGHATLPCPKPASPTCY